eukprot:6184500-Pleurochrysis_carterae.AAC.1
MKAWIEKKNEHKACVQRRWDNRGTTNEAFKKWKPLDGSKDRDKDVQKEKAYGIKHWSRVGIIPSGHTQFKIGQFASNTLLQ